MMQVSGYLPDKVFILNEDEALCKQKLVRRFITSHQLPEEEASISADVKYRNYLLYMTKIRQAFQDILIDVDSVKKETTDVFMSIKKIMEIYPKDKIA